MKKIYYNKLIRDGIPEKIRRAGGEFAAKKLTPKKFEKELLKKVEEEASALPQAKNKKELVEELADVMEVIDEIKRLKKISSPEIKKAQRAKAKKWGVFKKKLFLVWSEDTGYRTNEKKY